MLLALQNDKNLKKHKTLSEKKPFRILVIDKSVDNLKQLSQILIQGGFEVAATANEGTAGYNKYIELFPRVDLVILDATMPNMDGFTTLKKLVDLDRDAKVIMVIATGMEDTVSRCMGLGAKSYIKKPFDKDEVLKCVTSMLKKSPKINLT